MSNDNAAKADAEVEADECCAFCGIAPVDDIKLKECDGGCDLVKYCSDKCQKHEADCKKRRAELHDKELFEQPEMTCYGECPICFLPMPIDITKSIFYSCCCKSICKGCDYADLISSGTYNCPFCREPAVNGEEENDKRVMERVKVNDPLALDQLGVRRYKEGAYDKAVEYYTKAAELGDAKAHYQLGIMYRKGEGVERDEEKVIHHWEKAAISGHPYARHNLAVIEATNGNIERAVKHNIIAANLGLEDSMKVLWRHYSNGYITKEELEATLRTHKAAIDATKSAQRDAGEAYYRQNAAS